MNTTSQKPSGPAPMQLWPLVALLALALFPIGWLGEVYRPLGRLLDGTFGSVASHAIAHTLIFLALGLALLAAFPALRSRPLLYFGLLLLAAICQEGVQLLYKQRPLVFDDFRDIGTDIVGIVAAFAIVQLWDRRAQRVSRSA